MATARKAPMSRSTHLVGLVGHKGAGKDTFADLLVKEYGYRKRAFASELKEMARDVFKLTHEEVNDPLLKETEIGGDLGGITPRSILQLLGTEVGRQGRFDAFTHIGVKPRVLFTAFEERGLVPDEDVWVRALVSFVNDYPSWHFVVPDVRFQNEAGAIKNNGGILIGIERPGFHGDDHASETELRNIEVDVSVHNDGDVCALRKAAHELIGSLTYFRRS